MAEEVDEDFGAYEPLSTKSELEDFIKSNLWKDFEVTLQRRLGVIGKELMTAETIEEVKMLQGEGLGVNFWKLLPNMVLNVMEINAEAERLKKEQENE